MPEKLMITAPAKVNLSLRITGRRDDGYHELESLVAFAGHGDTLELAKASVTRLTVEGSGALCRQMRPISSSVPCDLWKPIPAIRWLQIFACTKICR